MLNRGWQPGTGGTIFPPPPGVTATKPGSATVPFPGIEAVLLDGEGKEEKVGGGYLAIPKPWPGMLRTIWGDDELYRQECLRKKKGNNIPSAGAEPVEGGDFCILRRGHAGCESASRRDGIVVA